METIHTGAAAITFPTTPEAFMAYQEQLIGRRLKENEWEVTAAWVELFNLSYEDGLNQDCDILVKVLDKLDELMARHEYHEGVHKFAEACRIWVIEAWKQGAERSASK